MVVQYNILHNSLHLLENKNKKSLFLINRVFFAKAVSTLNSARKYTEVHKCDLCENCFYLCKHHCLSISNDSCLNTVRLCVWVRGVSGKVYVCN